MVRMRTIQQTYAEIHRLDPESAISETFLRDLVKNKKIPVVMVGWKALIDIDDVEHYIRKVLERGVDD